MPSTTPPVAASSNQMCRIWSSITDAGYVMRTAPWMPVDGADRQRDVEEVGPERPRRARAAHLGAVQRALRSPGGVEKSRPVGLVVSESATLRPSASTMTTRPPALSR